VRELITLGSFYCMYISTKARGMVQGMRRASLSFSGDARTQDRVLCLPPPSRSCPCSPMCLGLSPTRRPTPCPGSRIRKPRGSRRRKPRGTCTWDANKGTYKTKPPPRQIRSESICPAPRLPTETSWKDKAKLREDLELSDNFIVEARLRGGFCIDQGCART
jgi:hypothetical protein